MVCTRLRSKFRRLTTWRSEDDIGPRQNKQTLKYLVDLLVSRVAVLVNQMHR